MEVGYFRIVYLEQIEFDLLPHTVISEASPPHLACSNASSFHSCSIQLLLPAVQGVAAGPEMPQPFLWIHKTPDSDILSRSAKDEAARIQRHVQSTHLDWISQGPRPSTAVSSARRSPSKRHPLQRQVGKTALASSLRPNPVLGRMTLRRTGTTAGKTKADSRAGEHMRSFHGNLAAISRILPWAWQGLSSAQRSSLAFFELRTSRDWAGWQDATFWTMVALPFSHRSRAVACSLIALSALHESMETEDECHRTHLQRSSILQGNEAIRALSNTKLSHFEALVSCVVLICFQNVQRSRGSFRLLRSGMGLLEECKGRVAREEACLIEDHVDQLFDLLRCRSCRMSDPSAAFMISVHRRRAGLPGTFSTHEPQIPYSFVTLLEARDCLLQVLQWGHDALALHPDPHLPAPGFTETLRRLRRAWEYALDHSGLRPVSPELSIESRPATLLQAACIFGVVLIETASTTQELVYDKYLTDFRQMVELVEQTASSRESYREDISFGIDSGLADIVGFVGSKCRDPILRRRALQVLLSGGRVEGDRIAAISGEILKVFVDLEEQGLDVSSCHDIPESHRRRLVRGTQLFHQRRIELCFVRSPYDAALGAKIDKRHVSLPGPVEDGAEVRISTPDAVFGPGYAEFLEDGATQQYFRLDMDRFYFPLPKG